MSKLSIIVPIYNVGKYLSRCIESILAQTYTDFELILINDGSSDNCAEIMERYAKKDNRIITIHQKNQGVSAARNAGLRLATGKYVGFVDPDDWIDCTMYQKLIHQLEKSKSHLVCCNWDMHSPDGTVKRHDVKGIRPVMNKEELAAHILDCPETVGGLVWNKVFLKERIAEVFDIGLVIGEDGLFTMKYCMNIDKASYVNLNLYHCLAREDSATREIPERVALVLNAKKQILEIAPNMSRKTEKKPKVTIWIPVSCIIINF